MRVARGSAAGTIRSVAEAPVGSGHCSSGITVSATGCHLLLEGLVPSHAIAPVHVVAFLCRAIIGGRPLILRLHPFVICKHIERIVVPSPLPHGVALGGAQTICRAASVASRARESAAAIRAAHTTVLAAAQPIAMASLLLHLVVVVLVLVVVLLLQLLLLLRLLHLRLLALRRTLHPR